MVTGEFGAGDGVWSPQPAASSSVTSSGRRNRREGRRGLMATTVRDLRLCRPLCPAPTVGFMRTSLVSSSLKLRITAVLRPNLPTALVSDGRVHCPHGSGDVDVDWCYTCPSF